MPQNAMELRKKTKRYTAEILNGSDLCHLLTWSPDDDEPRPFNLDMLVLHDEQMYRILAGSVRAVLPVDKEPTSETLHGLIQGASEKATRFGSTAEGKQWGLIASLLTELRLRREGHYKEDKKEHCQTCGKEIPPGIGLLKNQRFSPTCSSCQAKATFNKRSEWSFAK